MKSMNQYNAFKANKYQVHQKDNQERNKKLSNLQYALLYQDTSRLSELEVRVIFFNM